MYIKHNLGYYHQDVSGKYDDSAVTVYCRWLQTDMFTSAFGEIVILRRVCKTAKNDFYGPLLKKMQLNYSVRVLSRNTGNDSRGGKRYRSCHKQEPPLLHDLLSTGSHLLGVS